MAYTLREHRLLPGTDARSLAARRYRVLYEEFVNDVGGVEIMSEAQRQLARRASFLCAELERQEAMSARADREFDIKVYGATVDRMNSVFDRLGIKRVARPVNLRGYLDQTTEKPPETGGCRLPDGRHGSGCG